MGTHADKVQKNNHQISDSVNIQKQNNSNPRSTFHFKDNRPETVLQRKRQILVDRSPQVSQLQSVQAMANTAVSRQQSPVQLDSDAPSAQIHQAADRGIRTPSIPLPHAADIQKSFGHHDISSIQFHSGPEAAQSARAMNARAYSTAGHVVSDGPISKHTAAHEAAHVIQQQGGVRLKDNVGSVGDRYERHADAVGDAVVQGKSAEGLLNQYAGAGLCSAESIQTDSRLWHPSQPTQPSLGEKSNKTPPIKQSKAHQVVQRLPWWLGGKGKNKQIDKPETDEITEDERANPLAPNRAGLVTLTMTDLHADTEDITMNSSESKFEDVDRGRKQETKGLVGYYGASLVNSGGGMLASKAAPSAFRAGSVGMSILGGITGAISALLAAKWVHALTKRANRAKERRDLAYEYHRAVENNENPDKFRAKRTQLAQEDKQKLSQTSAEAEKFAQKYADKMHQDETQKANIDHKGNSGSEKKRFLRVMGYFATKNERKRWRARLEGVAYATGVAGGIATTVGMALLGAGLLALLASNPIGWGIALGISWAGVCFTLGQIIHKVYRKRKKQKQGRDDERFRAAEELYDLAKNGNEFALIFLEELGVLKSSNTNTIGRTGRARWYNPFSWGRGKKRSGFFSRTELKYNVAYDHYGDNKDETDVKGKVIEYLMSKTRSY